MAVMIFFCQLQLETKNLSATTFRIAQNHETDLETKKFELDPFLALKFFSFAHFEPEVFFSAC